MGTFGQIRYGIAVFLVVAAPPSLIFWVVVHPFAGFWRRVGYGWGYAAGLGLSILAAAVSFLSRAWIAGTDLGGHVATTALGFALLTVAAVTRRKLQRQLTGRTMFGLPELAPGRHAGRLLTGGIYARVRHPRYAQIVIAVLGWALVANHLAGYVAVLGVIAVLALVIPLEERELAARFGAEYEAYRRRVPALVPRWRKSRRFLV